MAPRTKPSAKNSVEKSDIQEILDNQVIRLKKGNLNSFGFEPLWNAFFDFYLGNRYVERPILRPEDITFHLFLRKNLNDNDPNWKMPSIREIKRRFGYSQDKIEVVIDRLVRAQLLVKVSGKRDATKTARNEYKVSDPILELEKFLRVVNAGAFTYEDRDKDGNLFEQVNQLTPEWKQRLEKTLMQTNYLSADVPIEPETQSKEKEVSVPLGGTLSVPLGGTLSVPPSGTQQHTYIKHTLSTDSVVVALAEKGFTGHIARKLAEQANQSGVDVFEKIAYLEYLLEVDPANVKKPTGWLRRAIENDFGAPDGYKPKADREAEVAAKQKREAEVSEHRAAIEESERERREQQQQALTEKIDKVRREYNTSDREISLWDKVKSDLQPSLSTATFHAFVQDTELLAIDADKAIILTHYPRTHDWLKRQLSRQITQELNQAIGAKKSEKRIRSIELIALNAEPKDKEFAT